MSCSATVHFKGTFSFNGISLLMLSSFAFWLDFRQFCFVLKFFLDVEDGHTLHLVVRQPFHSSSSTTTGLMGSESTADHPGRLCFINPTRRL